MKRIILETDNSNKQFLYEQVYDTIKSDILNGSIKAGEKLPSLRSLSGDLGLSLTTIEQAYNQLWSQSERTEEISCDHPL